LKQNPKRRSRNKRPLAVGSRANLREGFRDLSPHPKAGTQKLAQVAAAVLLVLNIRASVAGQRNRLLGARVRSWAFEDSTENVPLHIKWHEGAHSNNSSSSSTSSNSWVGPELRLEGNERNSPAFAPGEDHMRLSGITFALEAVYLDGLRRNNSSADASRFGQEQ